jgi:hypothetical protein
MANSCPTFTFCLHSDGFQNRVGVQLPLAALSASSSYGRLHSHSRGDAPCLASPFDSQA